MQEALSLIPHNHKTPVEVPSCRWHTVPLTIYLGSNRRWNRFLFLLLPWVSPQPGPGRRWLWSCFSVAITSWNWTHGLNLSWKKDHESLLTCWLLRTFLGPGSGNEVGLSTVWAIRWASWLRRSKQSLLVSCPHQKREKGAHHASLAALFGWSHLPTSTPPLLPLSLSPFSSLANIPGSLTFPPAVSRLLFLPTQL